MQKSRLKSTTSLVMSFSLIASPILAQQAAVEGGPPELCVGLEQTETADLDAEVVLPCLGADGTLIVDREALDAALEAQADVAGQIEQDEPRRDGPEGGEDGDERADQGPVDLAGVGEWF